ncbi:MAG TPA: adenosine kinase [SAR324 cluster bacterium]|jgi:sugar/nucleoside kinase (ribokinase family)|nr:adenosine kinase [Deltaproteobacteria bacterium]MDP6247956.1 adenosine kinase [SAR324 cluster bacterium]MDP6464552.1 adenosine kinase [SAR324 cluster bacterium]MDP7332340.1 adenosine kinase [SAR324 cluster bacterium]MEE1574856.1 adenosine kinase [Deltaproteobacteria bacterium]|tara:strand:- start:327 stop:1325 length:999 start_codon:yes stop_codon:yes gene_type:complete
MKNIDVYGVCNPLMDLLCHIPDEFLEQHNLEKNRMYLVSTEEQKSLLKAVEQENQKIEYAAGGSGANTMIGIAQLGGQSAFTGKIGLDQRGNQYHEDLENKGVKSTLATGEGMTGSSLILVSSDGSRTMNTHLGMCQELQPNDIDVQVLESSSILYLTGFLWDTENQKASVRHALEMAEKLPVKVALSLSDPFCVERHRTDFVELIRSQVNMLFCNQEEAFTMMETQVTQEAIEGLSENVETVIMTLGNRGSLICSQGKINYIDPLDVEVLDTTGAGDAYAAGFLYGYSQGKSMLECGKIASALAGTVIEQIGPRIETQMLSTLEDRLSRIH